MLPFIAFASDGLALKCVSGVVLDRAASPQAGQGAFSGGGRTISVEAAVWSVNFSLSAGSCLGSLLSPLFSSHLDLNRYASYIDLTSFVPKGSSFRLRFKVAFSCARCFNQPLWFVLHFADGNGWLHGLGRLVSLPLHLLALQSSDSQHPFN